MGVLNCLKFNNEESAALPAISGYFADYDFTDPSKMTLVNNKISAIADKSGQNNNLTQSNDANRPTLYSSGGIRYKTYARFDANLMLTLSSLAVSQPYTILMLYNIHEFVQNGKILDLNPVTYTYLALDSEYTNYSVGFVAGAQYCDRTHTTYRPNNWVLHGFMVKGSSTKEYLEGIIRPVVTNPGTTTISQIQIGSATCPQIDISRILVFNKELSDNEAQQLFTYFNAKYPRTIIPRVVSIGDSINYGTGSPNGYTGFTARVTDYLNGYRLELGIGGYQVTDMITWLNSNLNNFPKESYVIIQDGTNEIVHGVAFNSSYITNCNTLIDLLFTKGVDPNKIYFSTPPYASARLTSLIQQQGVLQAICLNKGIHYIDNIVPTRDGGGDTLLVDAYHPNQTGHDIMADTIEKETQGFAFVPTVMDAFTREDGSVASLVFNRGMSVTPSSTGISFTPSKTISSIVRDSVNPNQYNIAVTTPFVLTDTITCSYTPGAITSLSGGSLAAFTNYSITNNTQYIYFPNLVGLSKVVETYNATGTGFANQYAVSTNGISGDFRITIDIVALAPDVAAIGFKFTSNNDNYITWQHSVSANGVYYVQNIVGGTLANAGTGVSAAVGDIMAIRRTGSTFYAEYYRSGAWTTLYTFSTSSSATVYPCISPYYSANRVSNPKKYLL